MKDFLELARKRHSTRSLYDPARKIARKDLDSILESARWSPTAHNMQNFEIVAVDDPSLLDAIAGIPSGISDVFVRENYAQLSFSEEELMKKKTGLLGTMFPAFMREPGAKPDPAEAEQRASFQGQAVRSAPLLLVAVYDPSRRAPASEGDFLGIISLGCVMQNLWLAAESLGISLHIVSSLSAEGVEGGVKKILGIPAGLKIAFSARLGYPAAPPHKYLRVRRDVKDFTHYNRYGMK